MVDEQQGPAVSCVLVAPDSSTRSGCDKSDKRDLYLQASLALDVVCFESQHGYS